MDPIQGGAHGAAAAASRELMWNLGTVSHVLMYALMLVSFAVLAWGLRRRIQEWKAGKPEGERFGDWGKRLGILLRETFWQRQTRRRFLPGLFHSFIFYGFLLLLITTLIVMADMDFGLRVYHGPFYLGVTLVADLAGFFLFVGLVIAAVRRYLAKPDFLPAAKSADAVILTILAGIVLTGFLAEGARIRFHPAGDPWRAYSPIGNLFAGMLAGLAPATGRGIHFATWWVHALGTFTMIALIPHTKFLHMLSIPTNQFLSKLAPKGSLQRVDIEEIFASEDVADDLVIGVADAHHLTWKQRLDLTACIECGRCDEVCPARAAGQTLSPRRLIEDLKVMLEEQRRRRGRSTSPAGGGSGSASEGEGSASETKGSAEDGGGTAAGAELPIIGAQGTVFEDPNFIWYCRVCHACQSICPAAIEHVDLLTELRRAEVLMEGRLPSKAAQALKTMETQGNPFGAQAERIEFIEKLGLRVIGPGEETEILYWIGCAATFDPQKQRIAEDLVAILKHLQIPCGHLGREEVCCGDPARVLGEENLFQATAKQTVAALKERRFTTLLVSCPHGYNVFKNEYPQFGGNFRVRHHSQLLAEWLRAGRLKPVHPLTEQVVYHDPCFLGRYQGIYDPPRETLRAIPGLTLREMPRRREESFCCGAGGGHYWMDLEEGDARVNNVRVDEAAGTGAQRIAVACPFCEQMLTDGLKARDLDERIQVTDIACLVRQSLGI
ncbi:MAG: (Fe-S)-binding protein [Candidatus Eisenbacteria sp.]|nr:(Fe-S)-binding protein [Candidatus Eisenbacteria bacterium]